MFKSKLRVLRGPVVSSFEVLMSGYKNIDKGKEYVIILKSPVKYLVNYLPFPVP